MPFFFTLNFRQTEIEEDVGGNKNLLFHQGRLGKKRKILPLSFWEWRKKKTVPQIGLRARYPEISSPPPAAHLTPFPRSPQHVLHVLYVYAERAMLAFLVCAADK